MKPHGILIENRLSKSEILFRLSEYDFYNYQLKNILPKLDASSMYNQLEVREPMLDYKLVEFGYSLPARFKVCRGKGKVLLRSIVKELYNADHPRKKKGFVPPLNLWLNSLLTDEKKSLIGKLECENMPNILKELIDELERTDEKSAQARWHIMVLINWMIFTNVKY